MKLYKSCRKLECPYCDGSFKEKSALKEHMRKKQHKHINPKNTEFDKYYLINYLELGKKWEAIHAEDDAEIEHTDDTVEE